MSIEITSEMKHAYVTALQGRPGGIESGLTAVLSMPEVRQAIHDQWAATPIRDQEGAHQLKLMLKLLGDTRANLDRAIADGKIAAHELDQRRKATLSDFRR